MPVAATQKLLKSLSENMSGLVASRGDFATAVREFNVIQARSNLKEMATGCPNGFRPLTASNTEQDTLIDHM